MAFLLAKQQKVTMCQSPSYTPTPVLVRPSIPRAALAPEASTRPVATARCSSPVAQAPLAGPGPLPAPATPKVMSPRKLLPPGPSPSRPRPTSKEDRLQALHFPAPSQEEPAEVTVAGLRVRRKALLGRGSFSEVWSGEVLGSKTELALKDRWPVAGDIVCKSKAELDQGLLEASLLERFQPLATGQVPVMRIPRYYGSFLASS
eukprot:g19846.t1